MSRRDLLFIPAFLLLVAGVTWVSFGNPFSLEGAKLQEFVGYIVGLFISTTVILMVANVALWRASAHHPTPPAGSGPKGVPESTKLV